MGTRDERPGLVGEANKVQVRSGRASLSTARETPAAPPKTPSRTSPTYVQMHAAGLN